MASSTASPQPFTILRAKALSRPHCTTRMTLYAHTLCPYVERVWLTLLEKKVPFDLVHVDLSDKPNWYSGVHPGGLVPLVTYQDKVVKESAVICRWLDDHLPTPGQPSLQSGLGMGEPGQTASDLLDHHCSALVQEGIALLAGTTARSWGLGKGQTPRMIKSFSRALEPLTRSLDHLGGPYLLGPTISLWDILYFPFLWRYQLCLADVCGTEMEELHNPESPLSQWLGTMSNRSSSKWVLPNRALFLAALQEYQSLDFFDYISFDAAQLHPHLQVKGDA